MKSANELCELLDEKDYFDEVVDRCNKKLASEKEIVLSYGATIIYDEVINNDDYEWVASNEDDWDHSGELKETGKTLAEYVKAEEPHCSIFDILHKYTGSRLPTFEHGCGWYFITIENVIDERLEKAFDEIRLEAIDEFFESKIIPLCSAENISEKEVRAVYEDIRVDYMCEEVTGETDFFAMGFLQILEINNMDEFHTPLQDILNIGKSYHDKVEDLDSYVDFRRIYNEVMEKNNY